MSKPAPITATTARYIKLGERGAWESLCFQDGTLRIGFYEAPHPPDKEKVAKAYKEKPQRTITDYTRQLASFYDPSPDVLWVTFSQGHLWWCKAAPEVEYLGSSKDAQPKGSRLRKAQDGWHKTDIHGQALNKADLNGDLTKVSAYRSTICDIKGEVFDYLVRKINGQNQPEVERAVKGRKELEHALEGLICKLTPEDFELFVELIFSQSGWQRISPIGGTQKTIDLEFVQPLTNERVIVQVKSKTSQKELDEYLEKLSDHAADYSFYVFHSSDATLDAKGSEISLMGIEALAQSALRSGLTEWLIKKIG